MTEMPISLQVLGIDVPPDVLVRLQPRPPKGWKRPATKTATKCQVLINQEGRCSKTGTKLGSIEGVRFDHRPALWQRMFDPVANDTVPSTNDPKFIDAITSELHDRLTHGSGGDHRTGDVGAAARDRRVARRDQRPERVGAHAAAKGSADVRAKPAAVELMFAKPVRSRTIKRGAMRGRRKRTIPSRPFQTSKKSKRRIRGRSR